MVPPHSKPIHSSKSLESDHDELIEAFILGLGEQIDELQDAEASGDFERCAQRARAFSAQAEEAGYAPLVEIAGTVFEACGRRDGETVRKAIVDLTDLSQRARRGHRSSAG